MTSEYSSRYFDVVRKLIKTLNQKTSIIIQNVLVNNKMCVTLQYSQT